MLKSHQLHLNGSVKLCNSTCNLLGSPGWGTISSPTAGSTNMRDLSEAIIQHDTVEMSGKDFPNCGTVTASTEQIRPVPDSLHIFVSEHAVTPWFVGVVSEEVQIRETRAKRWSEDLSCQYPHSERGFMHISWAFEFQEPAPEEVPSLPLSPITVGT